MCGQAKGQINHQWAGQLDVGSIPSLTIATETELGPGCTHDRRAGVPTGWMTALPSKEHTEEKIFRRRRQVSYYALSHLKPET